MLNFLKNIVLILFAVALMVGTILIEGRYEVVAETVFEKNVIVFPGDSGATVLRGGDGYELDKSFEMEPGDEIRTSESQVAILSYDDNGIVRISPDSSFVFVKEFEDGYLFKLKQGRCWINNTYTSSHSNVIVGNSLLIPNRASFDVNYLSGASTVMVFGGQVDVGLIETNYSMEKIIRFNDGSLINSYLLPQGTKSDILMSKVSENVEVLRKLLYSKLVKEFKVALMASERYSEDPWKSNLDLDDELKASVSNRRYDAIKNRNLKYQSLDSFGYTLDRSVHKSAEYFVFSEKKKLERLMNDIFDQLLDAEYLLIFGRLSEADERLKIFNTMVDENIGSHGDDFKFDVIKRLRRMYSDLNFVSYNDELFLAKESISGVLMKFLGHSAEEIIEKDSYVRDYINYSYELIDINDLQARLVLDVYSNKLTDFIRSEKNYLDGIEIILSQENQITDNLLKRYYQFYQDKYFAMKKLIEDEWLKLLDNGPEKDEEKQTIISTKIDFLKQLQSFFLDEKVLLNDARTIVLRLINEIRDLQTDTKTGVNELFALRLKDYGDFLRFLKITDVGTLRGTTPKIAYQTFLENQKEQISIEQAIKEFLGEEIDVNIPAISKEEILEKIRADFIALNVESLLLGPFEGIDQKVIEIRSGTLSGVGFKAKYDWSSRSLNEIYVGDELLSEAPVRVGGLGLLIQQYKESLDRAKKGEEEVIVTETRELSQSEKVALILLEKKLKAQGIIAAWEEIEIDSVKDQIYSISGALLEGRSNIKLSFVFDNRKDNCSLVIITLDGKDVSLDGEYKLEDLGEVVVGAI